MINNAKIMSSLKVSVHAILMAEWRNTCIFSCENIYQGQKSEDEEDMNEY